MPANIDYSNGNENFVSFQKPAWWGNSKVYNEEITVQNALHDAGLAFHVEKLPNTHEIPGRPKIVSANSFFTYRTDTNKVLGDKLGRIYKVYQNTEALSVVDDLLQTKKVRIETAGSIDEGRRVFVCLKLLTPLIVGGNDEIEQYILLANGHDGSLSITAMPTNIRVVCSNTLAAALSGAKAEHKIRHTEKAADRVKEAFKIMGLLEGNSRLNSAAYNAMKNTSLTKQEFFDYIGNIFYDAEDIANLQAGKKELISKQRQTVISEALDYTESGPGQKMALGNDLNGWYAFNGITGYLTQKKYKSVDDRFDSLLFGDSAKKIKLAGDLALTPDRIQSLAARSGSNMNFN